jgi:hypothetical protein
MSTTQLPLDRGERLLWSGMPRRGLTLRATDAFFVPFSLLWAGFAVFWNVSVWNDGAPLFFRLWGLPFLAVGAYITIGRFWVDAARRAHTSYAVTDRRILISSGIFSQSLKSLSVETLSDVTLAQRRDGSGTITFGPTNFAMAMYAGTAWPGVAQPPAFELIQDAKRVYDLVRAAQNASRAPAA